MKSLQEIKRQCRWPGVDNDVDEIFIRTAVLLIPVAWASTVLVILEVVRPRSPHPTNMITARPRLAVSRILFRIASSIEVIRRNKVHDSAVTQQPCATGSPFMMIVGDRFPPRRCT